MDNRLLNDSEREFAVSHCFVAVPRAICRARGDDGGCSIRAAEDSCITEFVALFVCEWCVSLLFRVIVFVSRIFRVSDSAVIV